MDTLLQPLDDLQHKLLRVVGCTEVEALMLWNLAPLATRRDVAMLGVIHRAVLKEGPAHLQKFFQLREDTLQTTYWTRGAGRRAQHGKQLKNKAYTNCPELRRRSALGLIQVYNLLPAEAVAQSSVKDFQSKLQEELKNRAAAGVEDWPSTYSPRVPWWKHPLK